jgi:hypothetical protein
VRSSCSWQAWPGCSRLPRQPAVAGNGLIWQLVESVTMPGDTRRLSCFVARGVPTPGPVTFTFTAQQALCAWSIFEYNAAPGNAAAVIALHTKTATQNAPTLSLTPNPAIGPSEVAVGAVFVEAPNQPSRAVTAGAGCTQIDVQAPSTVGAAATLQTEERATPGAVAWNWNGNANAVAIVLAIKLPTGPVPTPPPPGGEVQSLIRAFEPILFFDNDQHSFPSDAKRFVEHSRLWQASAPFDDKNSWTVRVAAGGLSAAAGEPGTPLAAQAAAAGLPGELFLEFGGWLDKTGTAQPTVTPTSSNPYANRAKIRTAYATDPVLRESQFWYHAELFDTGRLLHLAATVPTPNLLFTAGSLRHCSSPSTSRPLETSKPSKLPKPDRMPGSGPASRCSSSGPTTPTRTPSRPTSGSPAHRRFRRDRRRSTTSTGPR